MSLSKDSISILSYALKFNLDLKIIQTFEKEYNNDNELLFVSKPMKKVNKQCLLDTPRTVRVSEKTWQVIVQTRRP